MTLAWHESSRIVTAESADWTPAVAELPLKERPLEQAFLHGFTGGKVFCLFQLFFGRLHCLYIVSLDKGFFPI